MIYQKILEMIKCEKPFSFARYGDGEWNCILHPSLTTYNVDRHIYYPDLSEALKKVLRSRPKYTLGLQEYAMKKGGEEINAWLKENGLDGLRWVDADVFHNASINNTLGQFMDELSYRETVFVAPQYLASNIHDEFIAVPQLNGWLEHDRILKELKDVLDYCDNAVVVFCAGMMSNVLIDEMFHFDPTHTYIDLGSALDPYAGVEKRSYHHQIINRLNNKV